MVKAFHQWSPVSQLFICVHLILIIAADPGTGICLYLRKKTFGFHCIALAQGNPLANPVAWKGTGSASKPEVMISVTKFRSTGKNGRGFKKNAYHDTAKSWAEWAGGNNTHPLVDNPSSSLPLFYVPSSSHRSDNLYSWLPCLRCLFFVVLFVLCIGLCIRPTHHLLCAASQLHATTKVFSPACS